MKFIRSIIFCFFCLNVVFLGVAFSAERDVDPQRVLDWIQEQPEISADEFVELLQHLDTALTILNSGEPVHHFNADWLQVLYVFLKTPEWHEMIQEGKELEVVGEISQVAYSGALTLAGFSSVASVAALGTAPIMWALKLLRDSTEKNQYERQKELYFRAREELDITHEEILAGSDKGDIYFSEHGWIWVLFVDPQPVRANGTPSDFNSE